MYKINELYVRPQVKKIDNITQKIGIDPKNIGLFEDFITKEEVSEILKECKKHEPEYETHHVHGKTLAFGQIDNEKLRNFALYLMPKIAENAESFYNMKQVVDRSLQYTFHPNGTYINPHTDVIGWEPKHNEKNEFSVIEKYYPYFWTGHLSTILYLNDDFDGGELFFPDFDIEIKPKPGMLAVFPGNTHYLHGVKEVVGNTRYTAALWTRFKDFDNSI